MKFLLIRLAATFFVVLLTACNIELQPISSVEVTIHSNENKSLSAELNQEKINALITWFTQHSSGWSSSSASYVPGLIIKAKHLSGEVTVINIIGNLVVVNNITGQYTQKFTESNLASLLVVLSEK